MFDRYNVLNTLYASSTKTLEALYRGMIEMLGVSEREWRERFEQLCGVVDGECGLEARVEVYLLGVGREDVEEWVGIVEMALGLEGSEERGCWAEVYADAAAFLERAMGDMEDLSGWEWCEEGSGSVYNVVQ